MNVQLLNDLYKKLSQQGKNIVLDRNIQELSHIAEEMNRHLNVDKLELSNAVLNAPDSRHNFSIAGTGSILSFENVNMSVTFFVSESAEQSDTSILECTVSITDTIPSWNLSSDYPDMPGYAGISDAGAAAGLIPSFLNQIDFCKVSPAFSTFDFKANQLTSLDHTIELNNRPLSKGINFAAIIFAEGDFWEAVRLLAAELSTLDVYCTIASDTAGNPILYAEHELTAASLKITDGIAFSLKKLGIKSGLTSSSYIPPVFVFDAKTDNKANPLSFSMELDIGFKTLKIESSAETENIFSIDDIIMLTGLKDSGLSDSLPDGMDFSSLGKVGLKSLSFDMSLSPFSVNNAGLAITTASPWNLIDNRLSVTPKLTWEIKNPFNSSAREVDLVISGIWLLGKTTMNVIALTASGEVYAQMDAGATLDVDALFSRLLPGIELPQVALTDMELYANYIDKTFSINLEAASDWSLNTDLGALDITDATFRAEFDEKNITQWSMSGFMELASISLRVNVVWDKSEGWTLNGGADFSGNIPLGDFFNNLIKDFSDLAGVSIPFNIPDSFLNIGVNSLYLNYQSKDRKLSVFSDLEHVIKLSDAFSMDRLALNLEFEGSKLIDGSIKLEMVLGGISFILASEKSSASGWRFAGSTGADEEIKISAVIEELFETAGICLPAELPDFSLRNIVFSLEPGSSSYSVKGECSSNWNIPIGISSINVGGLKASLSLQEGKFSGQISGTASIAGAAVNISYDLQKGLLIDGTIADINISAMAESFCEEALLGSLALPGCIPDINLNNVRVVIDLSEKTLTLSADVPGFGEGALIIRKAGGKWGFGFGVLVESSWKFSSLSSSLSMLDTLNFSGTSLIISSFDDKNFTISGFPQFSGVINKGLNFLMKVKMNESAELAYIKKLLNLNIDQLMLHCAVSQDLTMLLEGYFDGEFAIFDGFTLKRTALRIRIGPGTLQFSLLCSLEVSLQDTLEFTGEIAVEPNGASISATMEGDWNDPFGIDGIVLSDIALEVGISAEMLPTIGFAGKARIRNVEGEMGVLFNSVNPAESVLHLKFNELGIKTIFDICDPSILGSIPDEFGPVINSGLEDIDVHIVPKTTYIGQIKYEQGFRVKGKMDLLGWDAKVDMEIDQTSGITAIGEVEGINFLNMFKLSGANGEANPNLEISLTTKKPFRVHISGCVNFLGLNGYSIYADLTRSGFVFSISEELLGLIKLNLDRCTINSSGFDALGSISFKLESIGPVNVNGITLIDRIPIDTGFFASTDISITNGFKFKLYGSLAVLGRKLPELSITLTVPFSDFRKLYDIVISEILSYIGKSFDIIFSTVAEWANAVKNGAIQFAGDIANVSKYVFNATEEAAVEAYKILGRGLGEAISCLNNVYHVSMDSAAIILKGAGYAANEVAGGLRIAYGATAEATAAALREAGYAVEQVTYGLRSAYNCSAEAAAIVLRGAGYAANEVAGGLSTAYGAAAEATAAALRGAGYTVEQVAYGLRSAYNYSAEAAAIVLRGAGYAIEQVGSAVTSVYNLGADGVAVALKTAGYTVEQVGSFLKNVGGFADNAINSALSYAGYAASAIADFMKSAFGWFPYIDFPHIDLW